MRNFIGILAIGFFSLTAFAAKPICVRHYAEKDGVNVCEKFTYAYAYVTPLKDNLQKLVCARMYESLFCKNGPPYESISSVNKGTICILNNNQPTVSNLCETVPQFYEYIRETNED